MDKLTFALQVMVVGFLVVMVTLFLLYTILLLFNRVFSDHGRKSQALLPDKRQNDWSNKDKGEKGPLTAAIMAAVYRYMELEGASNKKNDIRITVQPPCTGKVMNWRMAGRKDLLQNRVKLEQSRRKNKYENF